VSIKFGSDSDSTNHFLTSGTVSGTLTFPVTVSIWFYSNRTAGREPLLEFTCFDNNTEDGFALGLTMLSNATTTNRRVEATVYDGNQGIVRAQSATGVGAGWSTNSWVHAAGVFETASRVVYLNGGFTGTNTTLFSNPSSNNTSQIQLNTGPVLGAFGGHDAPGQVVRMAEAAIWNAALTTDEILALSKGVKPKTVRPESLIFYSPLVRGSTDGVEVFPNIYTLYALEETGNYPLQFTFASGVIMFSYTDHPRRYG